MAERSPRPDSSHPPAQTAERNTAEQPAESRARIEVPPARIGGRYAVQRELGRGGMGAVYHVRDEASGRDLALKQLLAHAEQRAPGKLTAAFEREFYRLAQLSHPRVIQVYDYGVDARGPFYTMELLAGGDLKERAPLDYRAACALMLDICSCLSLLHSRRLVHRDISPRNIRCTDDGQAKLIDFGAVVPIGPCAHTVGTPSFVAPEVVHRLTLDARTDLFSLGATLYFTLTGRVPFAAREFADLRQSWAHKPPPASQHVAEIPPALDALLASLLSIDPAKRPRSAFEVSQRLQAIAGIERSVQIDVAQAYLTTPSLVGRDAALSAVRGSLRRLSGGGQGGGVLIESLPGLGRSRLLDACALEAKTLGAIVVRANARAEAGKKLAGAQQLAEQLLEALPQAAYEAAHAAGVSEVLLAGEPDGAPRSRTQPTRPRPRELAAPGVDRVALQSALLSWFLELARKETIVVAVDDVQQADEGTAALLAALAHGARDRRLLLLTTVETGARVEAPGAVRVLLEQSQKVRLAPLSAAETHDLFASIFGNVPHARLVSDRIFRIAAGSPRESIALAQHMLDRGLITYAEGSFTLPARLDVADLPASPEEAIAARLALLPELSRRLLETQALSITSAFTRDDYAAVAAEANARELEQALSALIEKQFVASDGRIHTLASRAASAAVVAGLPAAERSRRHRALAGMYARREHGDLLVAYHLLEAGLHAEALDRIGTALPADLSQPGKASLAAMPHLAGEVASMLERARELARELDRPEREIIKLHVLASMTGIFAGDAGFYRASGAWLARIERDSGLADYRALDPGTPEQARLMQALTQAAARYEATPEAQRVFRADEAIRSLAAYVMMAIVIGSRTLDTRLLRSLPALLEPFVMLAPELRQLHECALATGELVYRARPRSAAERWRKVYAEVEPLAAAQGRLSMAYESRMAIAYALGELHANAGHAASLQWIEVLDGDPYQQVNAMYLRRILCLLQADAEGAEHYRRQAEVLAVQATSRQLFDTPLRTELAAHTMARDLANLKQVVDRIEQMAARHPGWVAQHHLATGHFHRLRGDIQAAHAAYERCIAAGSPDHDDPPACLDAWLYATAGVVGCLTAQGRASEAADLGKRALARCRELDVDGWTEAIERELALAESELGASASAAARLDALIDAERRLGVSGLRLGISYEARARVAIKAHDAAAATHYAQLAGAEYQHARSSSLAAHYERLLDDARRAGVEVSVQISSFESSVLGTTAAHDEDVERVASALAGAGQGDARSPAERALALLCETDRARSGQLYLVGADGLAHAATHVVGERPDAELDRFVHGYFEQQLDDVGMTAGLTVATQMLSAQTPGTWIDRTGALHHLLLLRCQRQGGVVFVGVAVLQLAGRAQPSPGALALTSAIAAQLLQTRATVGCSP